MIDRFLNFGYPILLLMGFGAAAVVVLTARRRIPQSALLGAVGFGLMALGPVASFIVPDIVARIISDRSATVYTIGWVLDLLLLLGGAALLAAALVRKERAHGSGQPHGMQPGQQWQQPGQQYPAPQYAPQQPAAPQMPSPQHPSPQTEQQYQPPPHPQWQQGAPPQPPSQQPPSS